jgi:hypothetical protein
MLRWFWWRINAWTEIAAMTSSLTVWLGLWALNKYIFGPRLHWTLNEPTQFLITIAVSTAVWLIVTRITRPTERSHLLAFYRKARPGGPGWKPIAVEVDGVKITDRLGVDIFNWILGCALIYGVLFGVWKLMLGSGLAALILLGIALASAILIIWNFKRRGFESFGS